MFRAAGPDVYFLLLPFKICFCGVDRDNITLLLFRLERLKQPVPAAARSKTLVWDLSLARIVGSNPPGGVDDCLL
jgi:hypothetical protein